MSPPNPKVTAFYNIYNSPMAFPHYLDRDFHWTESAPLQDPDTPQKPVLAADTQDVNAYIKILAPGWEPELLEKELKLQVLEEMREITEVSHAKLHWKEMCRWHGLKLLKRRGVHFHQIFGGKFGLWIYHVFRVNGSLEWFEEF